MLGHHVSGTGMAAGTAILALFAALCAPPTAEAVQLRGFFSTLPAGSPVGLDVTITLDTTLDLVTIDANLPADRWLDLGFTDSWNGTHNNLYAIRYLPGGTVEERLLDGFNASSLLDPQMIAVTADSVAGLSRSVEVTRAIAGLTADHYSFPNSEKEMILHWSLAPAAGIAPDTDPGPAGRGFASLTLRTVPGTEDPPGGDPGGGGPGSGAKPVDTPASLALFGLAMAGLGAAGMGRKR